MVDLEQHRIEHLIVIAGPSAVGKSYLIRELRKDHFLAERLGVPQRSLSLRAVQLRRKLPTGALDHLILEYDILRPFTGKVPSYERDPATSLFRCAAQIAVLTLRTTGELLRAQSDSRKWTRAPRPRHELCRRLYEDDALLDEWYDRWLTFVAGFQNVTAGNYIVNVHADYALTPAGAS